MNSYQYFRLGNYFLLSMAILNYSSIANSFFINKMAIIIADFIYFSCYIAIAYYATDAKNT